MISVLVTVLKKPSSRSKIRKEDFALTQVWGIIYQGREVVAAGT